MHVWNFAEYTEPETLHSALVLIVGKLNYVFVEALSGSFGLIILIIRRFRISNVALTVKTPICKEMNNYV